MDNHLLYSSEPEDRQWNPDPSETHQERLLRLALALRKIGVSEQVTRDLLSGYPLDRVEQQLEWLPFRKAKRRSSLIVAAIKGDYERPAALEMTIDVGWEL